jgi:hypothetical protein
MTPKQTLIMWCLLGRQGQAFQREIVPKVEKKDREALVAAGYITSPKHGQAYFLKVEDTGWRWGGEHLRDELPPNFQVLQNWLARVHENLERNNQPLAEFIGQPLHEPTPESSPRKRPQKSTTATTKKTQKPPTELQLRERIEKAYLTVTNGRKAEGALLSKVRAQLSDLDRATVDAELLRILHGDPKARLGQISDPKALTPEERDAAFSPAGEPFHLLWIQQ